MTTIYRVSDSVDGKRHLAYSVTHAAFCGRVGRARTARTGPPFTWMTIANTSLPLPSGAVLCRQCERSRLNTVTSRTAGREG